ncbi:MAG: 2-C-methyl-D-erythritol 4-phosphate cytidylyltransferase [Bacteroidota bacterium]
MKIHAIIPSGGKGTRLNSEVPKQYLKFHGKELIAYTLDTFQKCNLVDEIIIPADKNYFELLNEVKEKYGFTKLFKVVEGGTERQYSVFNAFKSIDGNDDDIVVIHDAVRPLITKSILETAIKTTIEFGNAVVAVKAKDTLIKGDELIEHYIDRDEIFYVQTPQAFKYKFYRDAMEKAEDENFLATDESMLVHRAGYKIKIVAGSSSNFKITNRDDLKMFEIISKGLI